MSQDYANLITHSLPILAEETSSYQLLTERHLQAIWLEQRYFKNLKTSLGEKIEVISPGIWNEEAGPDFLKAHIKIGDHELKGDVEIHFHDDSWYQHGHDRDRRYNQVILHISLWKPSTEKPLRTLSCALIPKTYLEESLTITLGRLTQLIDLDLYPYKKFIGSGQCAQELYKDLPESEIRSLFQKAASHRLIQKYKRLEFMTEKPELMLGVGIAQALGYKHNAESFVQIFLWLSAMSHLNEFELLSAAIGACGFYSDYYHRKWGASSSYQELFQCYSRMNHAFFPYFELDLSQIRPLNHPIRRLVYLCKCLRDPSFFSLYDKLMGKWKCSWKSAKTPKDWRQLRIDLQELIPSHETPYWTSHYLFELTPHLRGLAQTSKHLSLIGDDLKKEILTNTFIPILYQDVQKSENFLEIQACQEFFSFFPASQTRKSRYLTHRFFGDSPKGLILSKADMIQGAYQLHRDFCMHFEASCEGCPFVNRYRSTILNKSFNFT